jgi:CBS domain-containing protein
MSVRLPAILGVRLRLAPFTLPAYLLLVVGIFAIGVPGDPPLSMAPALVLSVIAALSLAASYGVHELTHGVVGRRLGLPIVEVDLFGLASRASLPPEPPNGRVEALMAVSGVVASVAAASLLVLAWTALPVAADEGTLFARGLLWWAAVGNIALSLLNAAPAYPYDGGRVVRGLIWSRTGDKLRATRTAARVGRAFAIALMAGGAIWALVTGDLFDPIWLFVAGLFLLQSSRRQVRHLEVNQAVAGLTVADVMDDHFSVVRPNLTLDTLYDQHEREGDVFSYPVTAADELVGNLDISQIERLPRARWPQTRVSDVMTPRAKLPTMTRGQSVMEVLLRFDASAIDAIPVLDDDGKLVGLLTRDRLIEKLQPRVRRLAEQPAGSSR